MPRGRKRALREALREIEDITPTTITPTSPEEAVEEQPVSKKVKTTEPTEERQPVPAFSFFIPSDKVPEGLKEQSTGSEVTVQITGNITSSDETGITIDVRTVELV